MPRKPMSGPKENRLIDHLSLGAVMQSYPRKEIERILDETGKNSVRRRLLSGFVVVYLVILLVLYSEVSARENLRILLESLRQRFGAESVRVAVKSAISKQRQRIGSLPFKRLFEEFVRPVGRKELRGCNYRRWRIVAVDGDSVEIQNTPANRARFGIHKNQHGEAGYPLLKWVGLIECGTHLIFAAKIGGEHDSEGALFDPLISHLTPEMIHLADRYYYNFHHWKKCSETGAALVWRVRKNIKLKPLQVLEDGGYLATIKPSEKLVRKGLSKGGEKMTVRVIEYVVNFADDTVSETVRLITNILSPANAPAEELARLYAERWNIESGFDEVKTHLKGGGRVMRSQLPDLVEQEFYGFLLAYFVVRKVIADAAFKAGIAPNEVSFVHTVRVIRRKLTDSFFPSGQ